MSDAEPDNTASVIPPHGAGVALADNDETSTEQSDGRVRDVEVATKTTTEDPAIASNTLERLDGIADGDSEAETLIDSPEKKKKNVVDNAPRLQPARGERSKDLAATAVTDDADSRRRKRKRAEVDAQEDEISRSSSRPSSPLSSASDSDSESSNPTKSESPRLRRRNGAERNKTGQAEERITSGSQLKARKRRPSDILPHTAKHLTKHRINSVDSKSLLERRETRSATYPRRSSEDRSPSPEPIARREHRRGASTQLSSLALERKRRNQLPQINTRRNRSADRASSSDESSSPAPSARPRLHKLASGEQDNISPAKHMGNIRKTRDKNGRTYLARACNNNEFDNVKSRLAERPEDLNVADNAGNTPLQIAALEGYADIVQHLLENGCEVDTMNCDKDTPLIDAVENAHIDVIKLLLEYGADPRRQNAKGEEPSELIPKSATEKECQEIRALLLDARQRTPKRRRTDDPIDSGNREGSSRAASAASPRDSPPVLGPRSPPVPALRRKNARSESTPNHLLYQALTPENLIKLAEKGDLGGVAACLEIVGKAPAEALIMAAKAGHEVVLGHLLALGEPDPNPKPVEAYKTGFNTPMLAAIGRGKPAIIQLLLEQSGFNPVAEYKGRKYHEISEERQGHDWRSEYKLLKEAYDKYVASKPRKHPSPRKARESEKEKARQARDSSSPMTTKQRPPTRSPALSNKSLPDQTSNVVRDGKRQHNGLLEVSEKAASKHVRKSASDRSVAIASDQEPTIKKMHKSRRSQSDLLPPDLETETSRKRRRLVSGKEHRRGINSIADLDSEVESAQDVSVKIERSEKPVLKRSRSSFSPEQTRAEASADPAQNMSKKRRTITDSSPEEGRATSKSKTTPRQSSRESTQTIEVKTIVSDVDEVSKGHRRRKSSQSSASQSARDTIEAMEDVRPTETNEASDVTARPANAEPSPPTPPDSSTPPPSQPEASTTQHQAETSDDQDAAQAIARQAQEEEEAKQAREEAQRASDEAAAAEKKRVEEAEAEAEAEARRILEEAEAKKRAEDEMLAKRKEEEDRLEQAKKEMEERRRRQEEQKRQEFLEIERRRREALPSALCECARMLDQADPRVRSHEWLKRFKDLYTVTTAQIDPSCAPDIKDDEWVPNFQVAGLLATKDLNLRQYTSLEQRTVSLRERQALWRVANMDLSYAYHTNAFNTPVSVAIKAHEENMRKFMAMDDLFWVKWSDFNDQVFRHPHLAGFTMKKQPISISWPIITPTLQQSPDSPVSKEQPLTNGYSPYVSTAMSGQSRV